jgi:hypothetical protein
MPSCAYTTEGKSVWYAFTPSESGAVSANASSWCFSTLVAAYTGDSLANLIEVGCSAWGGWLTFHVDAGTTYYFQARGVYNEGGSLQFNLQVTPPIVASFSFSPYDPTFLDTIQFYDNSYDPVGAGIQSQVWDFGDGSTATGCCPTHRYAADGVYTVQLTVTTVDGRTASASQTITVSVPPPPVASFSFSPYDPTFLDTIQFNDYSYDPVGAGIQSQAWDFGDGATATGCCPTHRYAADGDYTVQLTVTTVDGRTASASQVVKVKTHDVAITRFSAPQAATAGQTRQISVGINSKRNPENVQVQLFKSVPQGFEQFGSLTQFVPVRPSNRTTDFNFSYTFTSDDASIGKVTFKAVAAITNARDALPADNEAIASPPTKVSK